MNLRRRDFLGAAAASAALAPFVPLANRARAAGAFPRRLLLIFTGNGTVEDQFWPVGDGSNFTFKPGSITEPLAPFAKKLIFPRGLHRKTSGSGAHEQNIGGLWTCCGLVSGFGYPSGPSVDQVIVQALNPTTTFKSLQFGVQCDSFNRGGNKPVLKCMTYSGSNAALKPEDNPMAMFAKLMLPAGGGPGAVDPNSGDLARLRARRKSVIDAVMGDLKSLSAGVDSDDRQKLEHHLDSLSSIEKRLQMPAMGGADAAGCRAPDMSKAMFSSPTALADNANFPAILDLQNRLAVAALACDRTRIASVQWSRSFSPIQHTWVGVQTDHHTLSHHTDAASMTQLHHINRWYGQRLAELLGYLDAVKEGDGTLLDHTVVIWGNEAATGNHSANPGITVVCGGSGGMLKTGQNINLAGYDWSQLLITLAHSVGASSVNHLGNLGMKDGDLPMLLGP
jgi:uncharacterized protein DUF1552